LVLSGGCVDATGRTWDGRVTLTRGSDGSVSGHFEHFGNYDDPQWRSELSGAFTWQPQGDERSGFDAQLEEVGSTTTTLDYEGTVRGTWDGRSTWSGNGDVYRVGGFGPHGHVRVSTREEVVDDALCSGQPASGETTLYDGRETVTITYDGAEACDAEQNARLSVDGSPRGYLSGICCSAGAPRAPHLGAFAAWGVALSALGCGRRALSRQRSTTTCARSPRRLR